MNGIETTSAKAGLDAVAALARPAVIAAAAQDIDALRAAGLPDAAGQVEFVTIAPDQPVPQDLLVEAGALVVEVDPASPASLGRLSEIRSRYRDLPVIAALREAKVGLVSSLLKQGVADVTDLPFDPAELAALLASVRAQASGPGPASLAPMLVVAGSVGGCGATTVLTHLAAEMARGGAPRGVCVLDLDLQGGEVAYYLGCNPKVTVADLLTAGDRLDSEMLRSTAIDGGHGFSIVGAPLVITALDDVDDAQLLRLVTLVRQEFDYVLVDLPTDWTGWALSVVMAASSVLMITELSVASLRQAKRRLDLFASTGIDTDKVRIVANRVERKFFRPIRLDDVAEVLGREVTAVLGDEGDDLVAAQDEGRLLSDGGGEGSYVASIRKLARALRQEGK